MERMFGLCSEAGREISQVYLVEGQVHFLALSPVV
jgi:hypothetical protein